MKKVLGILLILISVLSFRKVNALEYTYSEWSTLYPSGMDPVFIESEVRYKWFKFEENQVIYTDDYFTEYEGYMKDEASATTFYRYITNNSILLNSKNEVVSDESYCDKNFCYAKKFVEPTMVDMSEKTENNYSSDNVYEYTSEVAPMTGDAIIYSFVFIVIAIVGIAYYVVKKRKNMSVD